jgi:hypothetical protein
MLDVPTRYQHLLVEDDPPPRKKHKPDRRQARNIDESRIRMVEKAAREVEVRLRADVTYAELRAESYAAMKNHYTCLGKHIQPLEDLSEHTLHRWMVNFLRHERTSYNHAISNLSRAAAQEPDIFREHLRRRLLGLIADRYPALLEECERQRRTEEPS